MIALFLSVGGVEKGGLQYLGDEMQQGASMVKCPMCCRITGCGRWKTWRVRSTSLRIGFALMCL
jgi:hypothetical protein